MWPLAVNPPHVGQALNTARERKHAVSADEQVKRGGTEVGPGSSRKGRCWEAEVRFKSTTGSENPVQRLVLRSWGTHLRH